MNKIAVTYHRVSREDEMFGDDDVAVWDLVVDRHYDKVATYADHPGAQRRLGFERMMTCARLHQFEVLVVHRVDLLFRTPREVSELRAELEQLGIELVTVVEPPPAPASTRGRPRASFSVRHARELRTQGRTFAAIAAELGVGIATVHRALAEKRRPRVHA